MTSLGDVLPEDCLLLACDVAVRRALELAGKRMLTRVHLHNAGLRECPQYLIYARLPAVADPVKLSRLLLGAWTSLPEALQTVDGLIPALDGYARDLLATCEEHNPEYLRPVIRRHL